MVVKNKIKKVVGLSAVMILSFEGITHAQLFENTATTNVVATNIHQAEVRRTQSVINTRIEYLNMRLARTHAPSSMSALPISGLAGGDEASGLNTWASILTSDYEDDTFDANYDGEGMNYSLGFDTALLNKKLITGIALSYDDNETTSPFNNGGTEATGYTIAPYANYMINDKYSVDLSMGWGQTDTDMHRIDPSFSQRINGSQDSERYFYSLGANVSYWLKLWNVSWRLGYMYSRTDLDPFDETNAITAAIISNPGSVNKLGQISTSFRAGYYFTSWMPYFRASYESDTSRADSGASNDGNGFQLEGGLDFFPAKNIGGGLAVSAVTGRDSYDSLSVSGHFSYAF